MLLQCPPNSSPNSPNLREGRRPTLRSESGLSSTRFHLYWNLTPFYISGCHCYQPKCVNIDSWTQLWTMQNYTLRGSVPKCISSLLYSCFKSIEHHSFPTPSSPIFCLCMKLQCFAPTSSGWHLGTMQWLRFHTRRKRQHWFLPQSYPYSQSH